MEKEKELDLTRPVDTEPIYIYSKPLKDNNGPEISFNPRASCSVYAS